MEGHQEQLQGGGGVKEKKKMGGFIFEVFVRAQVRERDDTLTEREEERKRYAAEEEKSRTRSKREGSK